MHTIFTRLQNSGRDHAFPMLASGMAAVVLFVVAVSVVGYDNATKDRGFSLKGGVAMETTEQSLSTTAAGK